MSCLIENKQNLFEVDEKWLETTALDMMKIAGVPEFSINLLLTNDEQMREYNKKFREKDNPTDILSFPCFPELKQGELPNPNFDDEDELGDIIISVETAAQDAKSEKIPLQQHLKMLLAHGIAHLMGYTHEIDENFEEMRVFEKKLLSP
ncbi:rRNA maturation RNase YbeY [Candidatus Dependentiae bacterium]